MILVQQLAYPQKEVLKRFDVDFIDAGQAFYESEVYWREFILNDGTHCLIPAWLNVFRDKNGDVMVQDDDGTNSRKDAKLVLLC